MSDSKSFSDREYGEMIYSLLLEMNRTQLSQDRSLSNNVANLLRAMLDLNTTVANLVTGLRETRDKRYQEEIDQLEGQISGLNKQLEEKRVAKTTTPMTTSQEIRTVAAEVFTKQIQEEQKRKSIDWIKIRDYIIGAVALWIVMKILPEIVALIAK